MEIDKEKQQNQQQKQQQQRKELMMSAQNQHFPKDLVIADNDQSQSNLQIRGGNHFEIIRQKSEKEAPTKSISFLRKTYYAPQKATASFQIIKSKRSPDRLNSSFISVSTHQRDVFEDLLEAKKRQAAIDKEKMRKLIMKSSQNGSQAFEAFFSKDRTIKLPNNLNGRKTHLFRNQSRYSEQNNNLLAQQQQQQQTQKGKVGLNSSVNYKQQLQDLQNSYGPFDSIQSILSEEEQSSHFDTSYSQIDELPDGQDESSTKKQSPDADKITKQKSKRQVVSKSVTIEIADLSCAAPLLTEEVYAIKDDIKIFDHYDTTKKEENKDVGKVVATVNAVDATTDLPPIQQALSMTQSKSQSSAVTKQEPTNPMMEDMQQMKRNRSITAAAVSNDVGGQAAEAEWRKHLKPIEKAPYETNINNQKQGENNDKKEKKKRGSHKDRPNIKINQKKNPASSQAAPFESTSDKRNKDRVIETQQSFVAKSELEMPEVSLQISQSRSEGSTGLRDSIINTQHNCDDSQQQPPVSILDEEQPNEQQLSDDPAEINSQVRRERERSVMKKIGDWKETKEYERLGDKAIKKVVDHMKNKELKHSSTYMFLNTLAYKAEMLWPTGERIPFYQREFEERRIKQIMNEKMQKLSLEKDKKKKYGGGTSAHSKYEDMQIDLNEIKESLKKTKTVNIIKYNSQRHEKTEELGEAKKISKFRSPPQLSIINSTKIGSRNNNNYVQQISLFNKLPTTTRNTSLQTSLQTSKSKFQLKNTGQSQQQQRHESQGGRDSLPSMPSSFTERKALDLGGIAGRAGTSASVRVLPTNTMPKINDKNLPDQQNHQHNYLKEYDPKQNASTKPSTEQKNRYIMVKRLNDPNRQQKSAQNILSIRKSIKSRLQDDQNKSIKNTPRYSSRQETNNNGGADLVDIQDRAGLKTTAASALKLPRLPDLERLDRLAKPRTMNKVFPLTSRNESNQLQQSHQLSDGSRLQLQNKLTHSSRNPQINTIQSLQKAYLASSLSEQQIIVAPNNHIHVPPINSVEVNSPDLGTQTTEQKQSMKKSHRSGYLSNNSSFYENHDQISSKLLKAKESSSKGLQTHKVIAVSQRFLKQVEAEAQVTNKTKGQSSSKLAQESASSNVGKQSLKQFSTLTKYDSETKSTKGFRQRHGMLQTIPQQTIKQEVLAPNSLVKAKIQIQNEVADPLNKKNADVVVTQQQNKNCVVPPSRQPGFEEQGQNKQNDYSSDYTNDFKDEEEEIIVDLQMNKSIAQSSEKAQLPKKVQEEADGHLITAEQSNYKHKPSQSKIKSQNTKNLYSPANITFSSSCQQQENDKVAKESPVHFNHNQMQHSQASFATSNQSRTLNVISAHNLVKEENKDNEEEQSIQRGGGIEEQQTYPSLSRDPSEDDTKLVANGGFGGIRIVHLTAEDADEEVKVPSISSQDHLKEHSIDIKNLPTISLEEVARHKTKEDSCWTAVDGLVYDVTKYIPYHPGGKKIMLGAGKESSKMFHRFHPGIDLPKSYLSKLCIGRICIDGEEPTYQAPAAATTKSKFSDMSLLGIQKF